jgi:hypothetical protein
VSASAPPSAPARTIAREAQESRAAEPVAAATESVDYGREIELPNEIPPRAPLETVSISASVPADGASTKQAAPEPSRTATMTPLAAREARRPQRPAEHAAATRSTPQAEPTSVVVPVKLPADGTPVELVIRIVFERQD